VAEARTAFDQEGRARRRYVAELLPSLSPAQQRTYLEANRYFLATALSLGLWAGPSDASLAESSAVWLANGKALQQEAQPLVAHLQSQEGARTSTPTSALRAVRQTLTKLKLEPAKPGLEAERERQLASLELQERRISAELQRMGGRTARGGDWTEMAAI